MSHNRNKLLEKRSSKGILQRSIWKLRIRDSIAKVGNYFSPWFRGRWRFGVIDFVFAIGTLKLRTECTLYRVVGRTVLFISVQNLAKVHFYFVKWQSSSGVMTIRTSAGLLHQRQRFFSPFQKPWPHIDVYEHTTFFFFRKNRVAKNCWKYVELLICACYSSTHCEGSIRSLCVYM